VNDPARGVDVLVVGFGAAGASAAIAAHDAGAEVLVVERTQAGGGNCRHSGGFLFDVDAVVAVDHLDALCFGKTDRAVLQAFADGLHHVPAWLESLGGRTRECDPDAFGGMLPSWPHFPGGARSHYRQFVGADGRRPGVALWELLAGAVKARSVPVELDAPAERLIVDGEGAVRGAIVAGREIRARHGVVLASGGFEYDAELVDTHLPLPLVPVGHPGNRGDTLRLAVQAGASLWHMSAFFGWPAFVADGFPAAFTLDVHGPSFIWVDGDGRRFADETGWEVHDRVRALTAYLPRRPNRPRMPGRIVFDERARLAGPLHGIVGTPNDYAWSADNSAEVQRGWIRRGDTAAALADAAGLERQALAATLDAYAAACAAGRDDEFGRSWPTLAPLEPPLYAIEFHPGVATASGGPRRDARAQVLRAGTGDPIPGLYAAGAAGSIWGHLTEHGGGLTDAIVFGRIAGHQAAVAPVTPSGSG
jgi:succinate dehydrogenase/fumarate reductase flavoprotein subunit